MFALEVVPSLQTAAAGRARPGALGERRRGAGGRGHRPQQGLPRLHHRRLPGEEEVRDLQTSLQNKRTRFARGDTDSIPCSPERGQNMSLLSPENNSPAGTMKFPSSTKLSFLRMVVSKRTNNN